MARSGLPKKYAKMGFKKGWAAFKRSKKKPAKRSYNKASRVSKKGGRTMSKASRTRDVFLGLKDSEIIGGVGYAVAEPFIDQFTSGIASNIPVIGNVGDDVVKLLAGLAGRKYVKNNMARGVFNAMAVVNLYKVAKTYTPNIFGGTTQTNDGW